MRAAAKVSESGPIDVVYTWVDDTFPGYLDVLRQYSSTAHDRNPNRTRDNINTLKYSLRSLSYAPFIRNVYLVSCRPQVPPWLATDLPGLTVVHHDALFEPDILPTFNSFAIVSGIGRIPGLARRFFYIEDDMMFGGPVAPSDFIDAAGRLRLYPRLGYTNSAAHKDRDDISPWNASLAYSNGLLDDAFGPSRRRHVNHLPLLVDLDIWNEMLERWKDEFAHTRASRFRAKYNAVPEYLYLYLLHHTGRACMEPMLRTYREIGYCSLDNFLPAMRWRLAKLRMRRLKTLTLNDSFDAQPNAKVVAAVRAHLDAAYPNKSPFEI